MTPDRRYPICQLCGARHGSDDPLCGGPKVSWSGARVLRDVELVSWGPDLFGYLDMATPADEEAPDG